MIMSTFSETMRRLRFERHMTQEEFAELLGTKKQNISRYESGAVSPKISTAQAIADKLGISLSELSGEETDDSFANEAPMSILTSEGWIRLSDAYRRLPPEKQHLPDYDTAASAATEALIRCQIAAAPVSPLPILKAQPGVLVVTFMELAEMKGLDRENAISMIGAGKQDAATIVRDIGGRRRYLVAYNARAPMFVLQQALARELGHILIGHDGTRDAAVRAAEAECFANYLLFPRPLIRAVRDAGMTMTARAFSRATGCYAECMASLAETPGIPIPKQLNRILRGRFAPYVDNCLEFQALFATTDNTPPADLGTYMDNYEE